MLPAPCHWLHSDTGSYLNWHYGCIAHVTQRDGRWVVTLQWGQIRETHPATTREKGVRDIERWIEGHGGWPRRAFKKRRD